MALQPNPPPIDPAMVTEYSALKLTNGNLQVTADAKTGYITATRISDGAALLKQSDLTWGAAAST